MFLTIYKYLSWINFYIDIIILIYNGLQIFKQVGICQIRYRYSITKDSKVYLKIFIVVPTYCYFKIILHHTLIIQHFIFCLDMHYSLLVFVYLQNNRSLEIKQTIETRKTEVAQHVEIKLTTAEQKREAEIKKKLEAAKKYVNMFFFI